jgi:hypothetical protein
VIKIDLLKTIKLLLFVAIYLFANTLLVHAFTMHEMTAGSHDDSVAMEGSHGDCGAMDEEND